jgi:predicted transglutaminase-like cysteine proteinase
MNSVAGALKKRSAVAGVVLASIAGLLAWPTASAAQERGQERSPFIAVGDVTRPPAGWVQFCVEYDPECKTNPLVPRDVVLSTRTWKELERINHFVNTRVTPMTDMDHWGVVERWNYPDDGYGDCEDYALQKRKMLMQAGWPRQALLMTVVRDRNGDGHAVLTVKTDKGEFILDNEVDEILPWSDTGYHFVKRQSQSDPNVWVSLGEPQGTPATATSR